MLSSFFFFNDTATTEIYTLSLHDALPICDRSGPRCGAAAGRLRRIIGGSQGGRARTPARGARGKDDRLRPTAGHGALPDAPAPRPPPRGGDGRAGLVREGALGEGGRAPRIRAASAGCSPSPLGARNGRPDRNRYLERGVESPGCRPRDPLRSALESRPAFAARGADRSRGLAP